MPANLAVAPEPVWFLFFSQICDFTPKTRFGCEIWGFHLHFGEMGWESVLLGKSGALAGWGAQTSTKPIGFIGYFRGKSLISSEFHVKL